MSYTNPKTGIVMSADEALLYSKLAAIEKGCPFCGSHDVSVKSLIVRKDGKPNTECLECHHYFRFMPLKPILSG